MTVITSAPQSVTIHPVDQRSDEWRALRLGRLTGSRAPAMLADGRGKAESTQRRNLRIQLALERITGRSGERSFTTAAMQDGIDREPDAYAAYEALTGHLLTRTGFISHDALPVGCSLDGHVGGDRLEGIIEIKSPIAATHLEYLTTGVVPTEYMRQCIHGLWVTGAAWCDWLSYQPEFPEPLQIKLVRIERDESVIRYYEAKALTFLAEVAAQVERIHALVAA